jgi:hypothetical protein
MITIGKAINVLFVGCGGTTTYMYIPLLAVVSSASSHVTVTFIDGDSVEPRNLERQDFKIDDIEKNKAEVLATNAKYIYPYLDIKHVPYYLESFENVLEKSLHSLNLIVCAVDNSESTKVLLTDLKQRLPNGNWMFVSPGCSPTTSGVLVEAVVDGIAAGVDIHQHRNLDSYTTKIPVLHQGCVTGKTTIEQVPLTNIMSAYLTLYVMQKLLLERQEYTYLFADLSTLSLENRTEFFSIGGRVDEVELCN